jgi:hypothetical protein
MKTTPDTLVSAENVSRRAKHENGTPTPSVPTITCPDAQNMKTGPVALRTVEKEYGRTKYENGTDALGTAEN